MAKHAKHINRRKQTINRIDINTLNTFYLLLYHKIVH